MALIVTAEIESKLRAIAAETGRDPQEIAETALRHYVEHEANVVARIKLGLEQADRGEVVTHDQVMAELEALIADREQRQS